MASATCCAASNPCTVTGHSSSRTDGQRRVSTLRMSCKMCIRDRSQQTHVLLEDGSALTETVCLPQVCGVAVLCEGGGDIRVAARITELVSALLDLPSNRICVEQRKG